MKISSIVIPSVILFLCFGNGLKAQDTRASEERKARLEKEIEIIDRQLSENADRSRSELSRLTLVRTKISGRNALIRETDRQIRRYSDNIYLTQRKINGLNAKLDTLSSYYEKLIINAYKNRDAKVWYMYILASDDLGQAFRRYGYFKNLSSQTRVQADKIRDTRAELEDQKARLGTLKAEAEKVQAERRAEVASLQKEEAEAESIVAALKRNKTRYQKELAAKKRQVEALDKEIQRIIKGAVVDRFGQHYHPVFTNVKLPFNNGISIALPAGTAIDAVFDGVVKQIVVMPGYNQCVLVQHGNYFSFYCKLKSTAVKTGDKVRTGQKIGIVDTINGETQLHFQIWQGSKPQNPESWLRKP